MNLENQKSRSMLLTKSAWKFTTVMILFVMTMLISTVAADLEDTEDEMRRARAAAKPWLMRELRYGDKNLYISPASIICVVFFVVNLCSWLYYQTSGTWAEASHILVKDNSAKTHKGLVALAKEAGSDAKLFGKFAEEYSSCPSKKEKGDLGRFQKGTMAPPFDRAVFDPKTPLNQTIGPIETQFGLHLIYVRNRKM